MDRCSELRSHCQQPSGPHAGTDRSSGSNLWPMHRPGDDAGHTASISDAGAAGARAIHHERNRRVFAFPQHVAFT